MAVAPPVSQSLKFFRSDSLHSSQCKDNSHAASPGCQTLVNELVKNKCIDKVDPKLFETRLEKFFYHKFERRSQIRNVFISEKEIIDEKQWKFRVYLWLFVPIDGTSAYRSQFTISMKQLKEIEDSINTYSKRPNDNNNNDNNNKDSKGKSNAVNNENSGFFDFFPTSSYPDVCDESKETETIRNSKRREMECLERVNLDTFWSYHLSRKCDKKTLIKIGHYLNSIFSSNILLKQSWFWNIFSKNEILSKDLIKLISYLSGMRLKLLKIELKVCGTHPTLKQLMKLKGSKDDCHYHTCYIVSRPLNQLQKHKQNNKPIDFGIKHFLNHWALKFESNSHLLTIEFFDSCEIEIEWRRNGAECVNERRIFWFEDSNFTQRWDLIDKINLYQAFKNEKHKKNENYDKNSNNANNIKLKGLTTSDIACIANEWLQFDDGKYGVYNCATNNCQHFVRDFVSCFNLSKAFSLNAMMDHKMFVALVPIIPLVETAGDSMRIHRMHFQLGRKLEKFRKS